MQIYQQRTTADQMLRWSAEAQAKLEAELDALISHAFPRMSREVHREWVEDHFKVPGGKICRELMLLRNDANKLAATMLFDFGEIEVSGKVINAVYVLARVVSPEYQGTGIGNDIIKKVMENWSPDVLLTTCAQSATLHSWIRLPLKGLTGYEVYPRLETKEGREVVITVPAEDYDFVLELFRKLYLGVVRDSEELVENAIRNMTRTMVRKNIYRGMYDFDSWKKRGREDKIASALGATDRDGIVLMMRKVRPVR